MKLIVGLGNIGRRYEKTRHNFGFDVLTALAARCPGASVKEKFDGQLMDATVAGERMLLLWPYTLMNRSGQSVRAAVDFYQLLPADLLVICDDFNLPLGKLRLRSQGSAGGQKGMEDIINRLGTDAISRLRIGIGPVPDSWDAADFVLSRFSASERPVVDEAIGRSAEAAECWATEGIEIAMNRFN
ncbi:MAG TPA: aminoacyl-tRNA hydrolase [Lacipirellulaceae bacterium]|nr:aminoacyl-tRNA hydrolase [Lacipirellulaceae bacterium]